MLEVFKFCFLAKHELRTTKMTALVILVVLFLFHFGNDISNVFHSIRRNNKEKERLCAVLK